MKTTSLIVACTVAFLGCNVVADAAAPKVKKEVAQATALKLVPGEVVGWCHVNEDEGPIYVFDIKEKSGRIKEVEINANTGKKNEESIELESHGMGVDRKTSDPAFLAKLDSAKVKKDAAEKAALKKYSGTVEHWEAELEDDGLMYEFLINGKSGKRIVEVSSQSGKVTESNTFVEGSGI